MEYIIDIDLLKSSYSDFKDEHKRFNDVNCNNFFFSYLRSGSDTCVTKMYNSLNEIYNQIENGYNNIENWWNSYNNEVERIEKKYSTKDYSKFNIKMPSFSESSSFMPSEQMADFKSYVAEGTQSTLFVGGTSLLAGAVKLGEFAGDVVYMATGIIPAGALAASESLLALGPSGKWDYSSTKNYIDGVFDNVRRDLTGEGLDYLYNNVDVFKNMNEKSAFKYDSKEMKTVQNAGTFAAKVAAATAATYFSAGTAAPIVIPALFGTTFGVGKGVENYAQSVDRESGEDYNYLKLGGKSLINGLTGALDFTAWGQTGASLFTKGANTVMTTSFIKNFTKDFFTKRNLAESGAIVVEHGINYAFGDETKEELLVNGGIELGLNVGVNVLGSLFSAKLGTYNVINDENFTISKVKNSFTELDDFFKKSPQLISGNDYGVNQGVTKSIIRNTSEFDRLVDILNKKGLSKRDSIIFLKELDSEGACSYASVCSEIFAVFRDKPDEFAKKFGFSMFVKDSDGKLSLNTSELLSDIYFYANSAENGGKLISEAVNGRRRLTYNFDTRYQQYLSYAGNDFRSNRENLIIDNYLFSKDVDLSYFSRPCIMRFDNCLLKKSDVVPISDTQIKNFVSYANDSMKNGKVYSIDVYRPEKNNFNLRFFNEKGKVDTSFWGSFKKGEGHSMPITLIDEEGITVATWGKRLLLKWEDLKNTPINIFETTIGGIS